MNIDVSDSKLVAAMITRLRQACLHPQLLLKSGSKEADPSTVLVRKMAAKWVAKGGSEQAVAQVLETLDEDDEELQPVCMQCEDVSDPAICTRRGMS